MAHVDVNGVTLEYETYGAADKLPVILIMGLSNQLIDWPEPLLTRLAEDYFVVVFDNRDSGFSSKILSGEPYTLYDLAEDTLGLADALGLQRFHVGGFSMGGMISQIIAIEHPERVLSLVSLMSSDGTQHFEAKPHAAQSILASIEYIADPVTRVSTWKELAANYMGSSVYSSAEEVEQGVISALARSYCPDGIARQLVAMEGTPDREISAIKCPTLILHGEEDPCILVKHPEYAHSQIKNSTLKVIPGLGHEFPAPIVNVLTEAILSHLDRASRAAAQ